MTRNDERLGPESSFWAVTSYFNPASWSSRRSNYRTFRRHLRLPLLTVELAGSVGAELSPDDADLYLRVRDGDVMWQKERLLNLGFAALPAHVTHVAWIDCDIVFPRTDWWSSAVEALREYAAVQLFDRLLHLAPVAPDDDLAASDDPWRRPVVDYETSVASGLVGLPRGPGRLARLPVRHRRARGRTLVSKGVAWAARRELIASLGLYDREIVGGGDSAALAAFFGDAEGLVAAASPGRRRGLGGSYASWAARAYGLVRGRVGSVPVDLLHLWHGCFERRGYATRYAVLAAHEFDSERDLRLGADGAWRWATDRPALHAGVADYFFARDEDDVEGAGERRRDQVAGGQGAAGGR